MRSKKKILEMKDNVECTGAYPFAAGRGFNIGFWAGLCWVLGEKWTVCIDEVKLQGASSNGKGKSRGGCSSPGPVSPVIALASRYTRKANENSVKGRG